MNIQRSSWAQRRKMFIRNCCCCCWRETCLSHVFAWHKNLIRKQKFEKLNDATNYSILTISSHSQHLFRSFLDRSSIARNGGIQCTPSSPYSTPLFKWFFQFWRFNLSRNTTNGQAQAYRHSSSTHPSDHLRLFASFCSLVLPKKWHHWTALLHQPLSWSQHMPKTWCHNTHNKFIHDIGAFVRPSVYVCVCGDDGEAN